MNTTTTKSVSSIACATGALDGGPTRTRFFDGMFLTQADLETEQRYWRLKRRLTNRALGSGVVWGLRLVWQPERRAFALAPGYAIDCCGNDLVVECPTQVTERDLWSRADPSLLAGKRLGTANVRDVAFIYRETFPACIVLQYTECGEEPRTVQGDACAGPTGVCELSRVRETARLLLVPPPTRRETPPELFLDELQAFRAGLPSNLVDKVFPPQTSSTPATAGAPPVTLKIDAPGSSGGDTINFPVAGANATGAKITASQTPPTGASATAVVTFELNPFAGWGFTAGSVTDQGRTVETVTPPSAPSMYWSLDIALPSGAQTAATTTTVNFDFLVENLAVAQTFGGSQAGTVNARITGVATAALSGQGQIAVAVDKIIVTVKDASAGVATGNDQGCLEMLLPWGWTVDPANGGKIARVLVLAAAYAMLEEVVAKNPGWGTSAGYVYNALWLALFDVDISADTSGQTLAALSSLLQKLFRRWCDGFAYPGPRCLDEHHGVYLGCCEIDRGGNVVSFDMWTNRRYVVTGPLLAHWAGQLGIAPVDVIVGRFADMLCCIANEPAFGWNQQGTTGTTGSSPTHGYSMQMIHVGTPGTTTSYAQANGASVRYVGFAEVAKRAAEAFTAPADSQKEVIAVQLAGGGTVGLLVPKVATGTPAEAQLASDVNTQLKAAGDAHVIARARPLVAGFVTGVLSSAPASSLVPDAAPAATQQLAKLLDAKGVTVADLATGGPDAALARAGAPKDATLAPAADDLVDRAELAVSAVTIATVKTVGSSADAGTLTDAAKQKALAKALVAVVPKLAPATVAAAATKAARGA